MTQQSDIMRDILVYGKKTELGGVSQGTFPSSSCFSAAAATAAATQSVRKNKFVQNSIKILNIHKNLKVAYETERNFFWIF